MRTGLTAIGTRFGERPFAQKQCLFLKMNLDRDSLVRAQLRWLDPLVSIRCLEATLRTTHACPLVARERNGPDRYTHRPDIRRPPAREFLPVALKWRNWRRSVRKNQCADEREIVPGRFFCIRLATTNSENLAPGKIGARYSLRCADWSSASSRIVPARERPD